MDQLWDQVGDGNRLTTLAKMTANPVPLYSAGNPAPLSSRPALIDVRATLRRNRDSPGETEVGLPRKVGVPEHLT
jgi:hypothetical protein